jgi:hypothetical protein
LASYGAEEGLGRRHPAEKDQRQSCCQRSVDQGTVYEEVYVVEAGPQDGEAHGDGNSPKAQHHHRKQEFKPEQGVPALPYTSGTKTKAMSALTIAVTNPNPMNEAAKGTHLICWRSSPLERR